MFWKVALFLIAYRRLSLAISVVMIKNAIFDPIDTNYWLANLSSIESYNSCICQCYVQADCITANYYGLYQECILFSTPLQQQQLHVMNTNENTIVLSFQSISEVGE
jgi:hypothetical protein